MTVRTFAGPAFCYVITRIMAVNCRLLFEEFNLSEKVLVALYTIYDLSRVDNKRLSQLVQKLSDDKTVDLRSVTSDLYHDGYIRVKDYNYASTSYTFRIENKMMVFSMLYFIEYENALVDQILKACNTFSQDPLQKLVWNYIYGGFSNPSVDRRVGYSSTDLADVLGQQVDDPRFHPLIKNLRWESSNTLINFTLENIISYEALMDIGNIKRLIEDIDWGVDMEMKQRHLCLCDLIDYMSFGHWPSTPILYNNKHHCIMAALNEAYHHNYGEAFKLYNMALKLQGKYERKRTTVFDNEIYNFFFVLICYLSQSEEGKAACAALNKISTTTNEAAQILYNVLYIRSSNSTIQSNVNHFLRSCELVNYTLASLMLHYVEIPITDPEMQSPRWLIFKHEQRKYMPLDKESEQEANHAYGTEGLLSSIYRKPEWEKVLDELMGKSVDDEDGSNRTARLAYFIGKCGDTVDVRLQSVLKSGAWSAGKAVSMQKFLFSDMPEMNADDKRISKRAYNRSEYYYEELRLKHVLPEMVKESRLYSGNSAPYTLMEVREQPAFISLNRTDGGFEVTSNVPLDKLDDGNIVVKRTSSAIDFVKVTDEQKMFYRRLLTLKHFPLEAEEQLKTFLSQLGGKIEVNSDLIEGGSTLPTVEGDAMLTLQITPHDVLSYSVAVFVRPLEGSRTQCKPGREGKEVIAQNAEGQYVRVMRDTSLERKRLKQLIEDTGIEELKTEESVVLGSDELLSLIDYAQQHTDYIVCEWKEGARIKVRRPGGAWSGSIKKKENGWFEIEGSVQVDKDKILSMAQLLELVGHSRGQYVRLGEGEFLAISEKLRRQLEQLNAIASRSHGKLQLSPFSAALLGADITEGELTLAEDEELKKIRERIKTASTYTPAIPKTLNAKLRNYQKEGYCWMARLNEWGAGALLADDMGLGKTIQTIAFLLLKAKEGPALVVAPASVAPNWKMEFEKFAPSLNVTLLNFASDRSATIGEAKAGDVVVTTYGLLLSVKDAITTKHWNTICLDEAHVIKNRGAKTSAVAMQLKSDNRVMLTGTPVQNHLGELWNLFQFVNPGLLGSFEDFNRRFITPIEQNGDKVMQGELDRLIKPFMLRRTKEKVAKELPPKEEIYQHVALSEEEMLVYEVLRRKAEQMLLNEKGNKVSVNTLSEITRLRQCSCDCRLVEEGKKGNNGKQGSKINALVELLQTMLEGLSSDKAGKKNGGVLVFSQFTSYLALIREALDKENITYLYIDGSVDIKTRQKLVKQFQDGECPVFLISLKAGGLGLNLTHANYVIHADPWWNPAIEAQATDRTHRIGQQQSVMVYHLIAEGTIEEKIQRLHEQKQALVQDILEGSDMSHKLTGDDLLKMIQKR